MKFVRFVVKDNSEKRMKFVKLAEGRTQAALSAIRKLGNLANRRSYEFDVGDVRKIIKALKDAIAETERKFDPESGPGGQKTFRL
jgi:hypothetical protein